MAGRSEDRVSTKYWISHSHKISRENLIIVNEYLLSIKLANKEEAMKIQINIGAFFI